MNVMSYLAGAAQIGGVAVGGPLVIGLMRQVRARSEGRSGGGILQPLRDLRKQLRKQQVTPEGTTVVFGVAPAIVAGTTLLIAAVTPLVATGSPLDPIADLFAVGGVAVPGHRRAHPGRHRHRNVLRRHGREPRDHHRRPGRARRFCSPSSRCPSPSARQTSAPSSRTPCVQPRASRLVGRGPRLRRAGDRHRRRNRQAPGGQPRHPPRAHHGPRGDGARIRGTEARGRRMGQRHAAHGATGTTGKPVRALGYCECSAAPRRRRRGSGGDHASKWPSWQGRWPARRSSSPSCDCSACPSCLPVHSYWPYSPSCRPTSSRGRRR